MENYGSVLDFADELIRSLAMRAADLRFGLAVQFGEIELIMHPTYKLKLPYQKNGKWFFPQNGLDPLTRCDRTYSCSSEGCISKYQA